MKKILKKVCCAFMLSLIITMTMTAAANDRPAKIYNSSDLRRVMEEGGKGIFMQDIEEHNMSPLRVDEGITSSIDMNGYSLVMYCPNYLELNGNICLHNGKQVNLSIESSSQEGGTFAIKDAAVRISSRSIIRCRFLIVDSEDLAYERLLNDPIIVEDSKKAMTGEQFVEMVETGTLPQLEKEGYMFAEWKDQSGNVIAEWKAEGVTEIESVWEKDIQITFDTNGGTCDVDSMRPADSGKLKSIPAAKKDGVCFDGWLTESGEKVTTDTVFTNSAALKASWTEEAARAEALAACMDEQGFSQKSIDRHIEMLSNGMTASIFGTGSIWMIIALVFIAVSVVLGGIVLRSKSHR